MGFSTASFTVVRGLARISARTQARRSASYSGVKVSQVRPTGAVNRRLRALFRAECRSRFADTHLVFARSANHRLSAPIGEQGGHERHTSGRISRLPASAVSPFELQPLAADGGS